MKKLNTIEIHYYVDTKGYFIKLTLTFEIHKDQNDGAILYDECESKVIDIDKVIGKEYFIFSLKSIDPNLYRNINLIESDWDNMEEMLKLNLWAE